MAGERRASRSLLMSVAAAVPVVVDATGTVAVWTLVLGLADQWALAVVLALVTGGTVLALSDRASAILARCRHGARPLSAQESQELAEAITWLSRARLGPPVIRVYAARTRLVASSWWARPVGRRAVVVSPGLIHAAAGGLPADQVAAALAHAAVQTQDRCARLAPAWDLWSLPWQLLRLAAAAAGRAVRRHPLLRLAWSSRCVVAVVALMQSVQEEHVVLGEVGAVIVAFTYVLPRARKARAVHLNSRADRAVAAAGLGAPWADLLARTPGADHVARANELRPPQVQPPRPRPALGVVGDLPV